MKIPKKIQIVGKEFKIIFDKKFSRKEKIWGRFYPENLEIILDNDKNINKQNIEETLIHECFEVINYFVNTELHHDKLSMMSDLFYQIFKQLEGE
ncbi:MAG: hypothetical protein ACFFDN_04925 [Candidatus Hodarchaeota archaeon]